MTSFELIHAEYATQITTTDYYQASSLARLGDHLGLLVHQQHLDDGTNSTLARIVDFTTSTWAYGTPVDYPVNGTALRRALALTSAGHVLAMTGGSENGGYRLLTVNRAAHTITLGAITAWPGTPGALLMAQRGAMLGGDIAVFLRLHDDGLHADAVSADGTTVTATTTLPLPPGSTDGYGSVVAATNTTALAAVSSSSGRTRVYALVYGEGGFDVDHVDIEAPYKPYAELYPGPAYQAEIILPDPGDAQQYVRRGITYANGAFSVDVLPLAPIDLDQRPDGVSVAGTTLTVRNDLPAMYGSNLVITRAVQIGAIDPSAGSRGPFTMTGVVAWRTSGGGDPTLVERTLTVTADPEPTYGDTTHTTLTLHFDVDVAGTWGVDNGFVEWFIYKNESGLLSSGGGSTGSLPDEESITFTGGDFLHHAELWYIHGGAPKFIGIYVPPGFPSGTVPPALQYTDDTAGPSDPGGRTMSVHHDIVSGEIEGYVWDASLRGTDGGSANDLTGYYDIDLQTTFVATTDAYTVAYTTGTHGPFVVEHVSGTVGGFPSYIMSDGKATLTVTSDPTYGTPDVGVGFDMTVSAPTPPGSSTYTTNKIVSAYVRHIDPATRNTSGYITSWQNLPRFELISPSSGKAIHHIEWWVGDINTGVTSYLGTYVPPGFPRTTQTTRPPMDHLFDQQFTVGPATVRLSNPRFQGGFLTLDYQQSIPSGVYVRLYAANWGQYLASGSIYSGTINGAIYGTFGDLGPGAASGTIVLNTGSGTYFGDLDLTHYFIAVLARQASNGADLSALEAVGADLELFTPVPAGDIRLLELSGPPIIAENIAAAGYSWRSTFL